MYKQGWVHYNLGEWQEALDLFRAVINFGERRHPGPPPGPEARAREGGPQGLRPDLQPRRDRRGGGRRLPPDRRRRRLVRHAQARSRRIFDEDGKDRDAIVVFARLIREKPLSPEAPAFQARVIMIAGRMGKKEAAVQQAHVFVKMLQEIEAAVGKDEKGQAQLAAAKKDAENTLRILAVTYHNEWKKTRDDPVAGWAAVSLRRLPRGLPQVAARLRDALLPRRAAVRARRVREGGRGVREDRAGGRGGRKPGRARSR